MEHLYWEERLQGYLDDELGPADSMAVKQHIDECEDCAANYRYFVSLKRRLKCHTNTVEIPEAVEERLQKMFEGKRKRVYRPWMGGLGAAVAAALIMAVFLPRFLDQPFKAAQEVLVGKVICYDCCVADRAGLTAGVLCSDKHLLGIECEDGNLWRFADDEVGHKYIESKALYGKRVRVWGETIKGAHLVRIKNLEELLPQQAALRRAHYLKTYN